MKQNLPVTQREYEFREADRIVSTTDLKGAITYGNDAFFSVSGFSADELHGVNHNAVRHPDMPPAAFADLWSTLKAGKTWIGIVKNRRKNGDHYWVDATVTPILDGNTVVGYQSVRSKPLRQHVHNAEKLYAALWQTRPAWQQSLERLRPKLQGRITLTALLTLLPTALAVIASSPDATTWIALGTSLTIALSGAALVARPWQKAAKESLGIIDNTVALGVYSGRQDELGQLQLALKMLDARMQTVNWRIADATTNLSQAAAMATTATEQVAVQMAQQQAEIEQVATAMNEMTATVHEVARHAVDTAEATRNADQDAAAGQQVVTASVHAIDELARQVDRAEAVINELARDTDQIGNVINVIRGVAEQTNLLALNAAIEAARAGDAGRGFAVVADEVRRLAQSTSTSTEDIRTIILSLQGKSETAVALIEASREAARNSVTRTNEAGQTLTGINQAVNEITGMNVQIATAAEEQSAVSEEINRNLVNINTMSQETLAGARESTQANLILTEEIRRLNVMVQQFGRTRA